MMYGQKILIGHVKIVAVRYVFITEVDTVRGNDAVGHKTIEYMIAVLRAQHIFAA